MLSVHFTTSFLLLALCASVQHTFAAPTKPLPTCFTSEIDLTVKWPVTLTATGSQAITACNGTVLGHVDDAGLLAIKTSRVGTLPNHLEVYMPNSTCFLPYSEKADEVQAEAIGSPYTALSTRSVPCGTTLYLPALDGLVLPKGAGVHNGCVRAVNRQAEIADKCDAVLNIGSVENRVLFADLIGEQAIQPKTCVPGAFRTYSLTIFPKQLMCSRPGFSTFLANTAESEDDSEEFDYPDPSAASKADVTSSRLVLISTGSDSEDASYSLDEDASYSLSEDSDHASKSSDPTSGSTPANSNPGQDSTAGQESNPGSTPGQDSAAGQDSTAESNASDSDIEWVDCDENGNPIVSSDSSAPTTLPSTDSTSNIVYVYVECDENGNPISTGSGNNGGSNNNGSTPGNNSNTGSTPSSSTSSTDDEIVYVDCDENGNPIIDSSASGSEDIEYVDCDENGNPISNGSGSDSEDIVYVDCDENGNPIIDGSDSGSIEYVDCDENGNPI